MKYKDKSILTPRQFEVAQLICLGLSNDEIGKRLFLSERSIEAHSQAIYKKLHIANRTALISQLSQGVTVQKSLKEKPCFFRLNLAQLPTKPERPKPSIYHSSLLKQKKLRIISVISCLRDQILYTWWIPSKSKFLKDIDDLIAIVSDELS